MATAIREWRASRSNTEAATSPRFYRGTREQRTRELSDVMQRVAAGRQTLADIQLLADELGIPLTIVTT